MLMSAKANELKESGKEVIMLTRGEPDFATPEHIIDAASKAMHEGYTKYTPANGFKDLRQAVAAKLKDKNNLDYSDEEVLITAGCKNSFFTACAAILNQGDEVLLPAPYWVSYPEIINFFRAKINTVDLSVVDNFKLTPEILRENLTPKTKMLVFNSPCNPSGCVYTKQELFNLAQVLLEFPDLCIISDDIYEDLIWDQEFYNLPMVEPKLKPQTIIVHGFSKSYAMTGWRIGYAAGPKDTIKRMKTIQAQSVSHPCSISQRAALAAITLEQKCVMDMALAYKERTSYCVKALQKLSIIKCPEIKGSYYAFPDMRKLINKIPGVSTDLQLVDLILDETLVAVVPGSNFGCPGFIRISCAASMEELKVAVNRLVKFIIKYGG
jgi:aspartate aminotransferase